MPLSLRVVVCCGADVNEINVIRVSRVLDGKRVHVLAEQNALHLVESRREKIFAEARDNDIGVGEYKRHIGLADEVTKILKDAGASVPMYREGVSQNAM